MPLPFPMKKSKAHFPQIPPIAYEGPKSENPLAFRHYNPAEIIDGKPLKDHLRFSIAYWHSFRGRRLRSVRAGHDRPAVGNAAAIPWPSPRRAWTPPSSFS